MTTFNSLTCEVCKSIVDYITQSGSIVITCTSCNHTRKSEPDDTLMSSGYVNDDVANNDMYERTLRYGAFQPYNPKPSEPVKCPNCKKTENVRYVRLGTSETRYFLCTCGKNGQSYKFIPDRK